MRILITGGRGMVGSALVRRLSANHNVVAPTRAELPLDHRDASAEAVAALAPDLIIHAAGRVGGIEANRRARSAFLEENVTMGLNVLAAARSARVPRVLNLASSCIYPKDIAGPISERMLLGGPLEPTNEGYAIAKIAVLLQCEYLTEESEELRYKSAIPCNLYGPGDHFDSDRAHLIPAAISKLYRAVSSGAQTVEIWGDGSARREFMYVEDLATFVEMAVDSFDTLPDRVNVGLGADHTVMEYYQSVAAAAGFHGEFVFDLNRPVGMRRKLLDTTVVNDWGWRPKCSLEEGIQATYEYYRDAVSTRNQFLG